MDKHQARSLLQQYWGYQDFRGIQYEIISSVLEGKDTLGLMPTGGGKSITFQVPALMLEGTCVVITPLIALMVDQVKSLKEKGITAAAIHAGLSKKETIQVLENAIFGGLKLLYVSPERLESELFLTKIKRIKVNLIAVDEAHCISMWGYDFRPSYLKISDIRKLLPEAPLLALTATATPKVIADIQQKLEFKAENVFKMTFARANLAYIVRHATDRYDEMEHILRSVDGSAIIYVARRKKAKEIAQMLKTSGFSVTYYHAGLEPSIKNNRQNDWQQNKIRIMVATNAFGMGIDKPDVRLVIHLDSPSSPESYFQEAGRAGRDGKKSYAILLWSGHEIKKLQKRVTDTFPPKDYIRKVYQDIAYFYQVGLGSGAGYTFNFYQDKFSANFDHTPHIADAALKILSQSGYIDYQMDKHARAKVTFLLKRDELYLLNQQPKDNEAVTESLLRNYSGLFTDYVYIDEALLAQDTGLPPHQVYVALKDLARNKIINFIPQRQNATIRYMHDRCDINEVIIPNGVYEERKKIFEKKINSMIYYGSNDQVCRSRQLLLYFGEIDTQDCGICDVCVRRKGRKNEKQQLHETVARIKEALNDGKKHLVTELKLLKVERDLLSEALEFMVAEDMLDIEYSFITLKK